MRAVILKARQIGFSTLAQALTIWRTTLQQNHTAIVVAQDLDTGAKLFKMGRTMYMHLPQDETLKPPVSHFKRSRFMAFGNLGVESWENADVGVDSEYLVSTATETESGRGGTYRTIHGSEVAMWPDIDGKVTSLTSGMPEDPDTLVLWESTAKGLNGFKDIWDEAVAGSGFLPFFWPWWKHAEYRMEFMDEREREEFRPGDIDQSPYAEREPALLDPGPLDFEIERARPALARATQVAALGDRQQVQRQAVEVRRGVPDRTGGCLSRHGLKGLRGGPRSADPEERGSAGGSARGDRGEGPRGPCRRLRQGRGSRQARATRRSKKLMPGVSPDWKFWIDLEEDEQTKVLRPPKDGLYVLRRRRLRRHHARPKRASRPSTRSRSSTTALASRLRSTARVSTRSCLAEHVFLTAHFFNEAWLGVEITGGYGYPVVRTIVQDWRYRFNYMRKTHDRQMDSTQDRLGWDTRPNTKPILLALGEEIIRGETSGIRSLELTRRDAHLHKGRLGEDAALSAASSPTG